MERVASIRTHHYHNGDGSIEKAFRHNLPGRIANNADPDRKDLVFEIHNERGEMDYRHYVDNKLMEYTLKGSLGDKKIRKDAVLSMEVVVRANGVFLDVPDHPPTDFDIEKWSKDTFAWADRVFNPENHEIHYLDRRARMRTEKVQNIYSATLHLDESTPHIHFMILPIDKNGHLTAAPYRSPQFYRKLQPDYYNEVGKLYGLALGKAGSPARAVDISSFHTKLLEPLSYRAPDYYPDETLQEYKKRVDEEIVKCHVHMRDQELRHEREKNHMIADSRQSQYKLAVMSRELTGEFTYEPDMERMMDRIHDLKHSEAKYEEEKKAFDECPDRQYAEDTRRRLLNILYWENETGQYDRIRREDKVI